MTDAVYGTQVCHEQWDFTEPTYAASTTTELTETTEYAYYLSLGSVPVTMCDGVAYLSKGSVPIVDELGNTFYASAGSVPFCPTTTITEVITATFVHETWNTEGVYGTEAAHEQWTADVATTVTVAATFDPAPVTAPTVYFTISGRTGSSGAYTAIWAGSVDPAGDPHPASFSLYPSPQEYVGVASRTSFLLSVMEAGVPVVHRFDLVANNVSPVSGTITFEYVCSDC